MSSQEMFSQGLATGLSIFFVFFALLANTLTGGENGTDIEIDPDP